MHQGNPGPLDPPLPEGFLFGVATADHQCEAYDERFPDLFDIWEREAGLTPRGRATDFWNRYAEDIELARGLGCTAFRLSIAWARVEPEPGQWNEEAFQHYRQVIEAVRSAGMEPVVTLHHFTWPLHVHNRGGMLDERFPEWLGAYAGECARRLGASVRYWITINEPTLLPFGYVKLWWQRNYKMPPGMGEASAEEQVEAVARLIRTLFRAHAAARSAIKHACPGAAVSANPFLLGLPPWFQSWLDRRLIGLRKEAIFKRHGRLKVRRKPTITGGADVTFSMLSCTPDRMREVLFSQPYYCAQPALLLPATAGADPAGHDWKGTIAVVAGSTAPELRARAFPRAAALSVRSLADGVRAVERGGALLDHRTRLGPIARAHPVRFRLVDVNLPLQPYAAAVAHGDTDLLDAVDAAIREFVSSGAWRDSIERHLPGEPVPEPPRVLRRVSLSSPLGSPHTAAQTAPRHVAGALRTVNRRGRLVVAVRDDAPGFSARNPETGELEGLEIDLARAAARHILGDERRVQFRVVNVAQRLTSVRSVWSRYLEPAHKLYSLSSVLFNTHWWHLGMAGRLPEFLCPRECVGQQDFIGLDYYWGVESLDPRELLRLLEATEQRYEHAPVSPRGLYNTLKRLSRLFPGQQLLVIENGCVEAADGVRRADYLRGHVRQIQRACAEGIPLIGYICWSITSNREWGLPFWGSTDFGLHHIALDEDPELTRVPTEAAELLRAIIARRGVEPDPRSAGLGQEG